MWMSCENHYVDFNCPLIAHRKSASNYCLFCNLYKIHIGQQFRSSVVVVVFVFKIPPTAKVIVICPSEILKPGVALLPFWMVSPA